MGPREWVLASGSSRVGPGGNRGPGESALANRRPRVGAGRGHAWRTMYPSRDPHRAPRLSCTSRPWGNVCRVAGPSAGQGPVPHIRFRPAPSVPEHEFGQSAVGPGAWWVTASGGNRHTVRQETELHETDRTCRCETSGAGQQRRVTHGRAEGPPLPLARRHERAAQERAQRGDQHGDAGAPPGHRQ